MTALREKWQITAKLSKNLGQYTIRVCHPEVANRKCHQLRISRRR
jgi:hypothetical protein